MFAKKKEVKVPIGAKERREAAHFAHAVKACQEAKEDPPAVRGPYGPWLIVYTGRPRRHFTIANRHTGEAVTLWFTDKTWTTWTETQAAAYLHEVRSA